jgi:hypothetical protein
MTEQPTQNHPNDEPKRPLRMSERPLTPPPELARQWSIEAEQNHRPTVAYSLVTALATRAAQWGADQELEACCKVIEDELSCFVSGDLRAARRPQPLSLKQQALVALHAIATGANDTREQHQDLDTIRHALEALPDD